MRPQPRAEMCPGEVAFSAGRPCVDDAAPSVRTWAMAALVPSPEPRQAGYRAGFDRAA
jgi:hypothetical protein